MVATIAACSRHQPAKPRTPAYHQSRNQNVPTFRESPFLIGARALADAIVTPLGASADELGSGREDREGAHDGDAQNERPKRRGIVDHKLCNLFADIFIEYVHLEHALPSPVWARFALRIVSVRPVVAELKEGIVVHFATIECPQLQHLKASPLC